MATHMIVGYWPLLDPASMGVQAGTPVADYKSLIQQLYDEYPSGKADAVLWTSDSETHEVAPVFMMPKAKEIGAHLMAWTEGKPEAWFTFYAYWAEDKYALALVPKADMSVRRYKLARLMFADDLVGDDEFIVLSSPLGIGAKLSDVSRRLRGKLPTDFIEVGLLDPVDAGAPFGQMPNPDRADIVHLGRFEVGRVNDGAMSVLQQMLDFD